MLLHVTKSYYILCSVVMCYLELLHDVLHVAKVFYMRCSVVTRCIVLLNFMQQCYML